MAPGRFAATARRVAAAVAVVAQFRQKNAHEPEASNSSNTETDLPNTGTALRRACFQHAREFFKAFRRLNPGWDAAAVMRAAFLSVYRGMRNALRCNAIIELWQRVADERRQARELANGSLPPPEASSNSVNCQVEPALGDVFGRMHQLIQKIRSDPGPSRELRRFSEMAGRLDSTFARLAKASELLNACGDLNTHLEKDVRMAHALLRRLSRTDIEQAPVSFDMGQPKELLEQLEQALAARDKSQESREARMHKESELAQTEVVPKAICHEGGVQQTLPSIQVERESRIVVVPCAVEPQCEVELHHEPLAQSRTAQNQTPDTTAAMPLDIIPQSVVCSVSDLAPPETVELNQLLPQCSLLVDSSLSESDRDEVAMTLDTVAEINYEPLLPERSRSPGLSLVVEPLDDTSNVSECATPLGNLSRLMPFPSGQPEDDLLQPCAPEPEQRAFTPELTQAWSEPEAALCKQHSGLWHRCNVAPALGSLNSTRAGMPAERLTCPKLPLSHIWRPRRRSVDGLRPMTAEAVFDARRRLSDASSVNFAWLPCVSSSSEISRHESRVQRAMARLTPPCGSAVASRDPSIANRQSSPRSSVSSDDFLEAAMLSEGCPRLLRSWCGSILGNAETPRVSMPASRLWTPIKKFGSTLDDEPDRGRATWPNHDKSGCFFNRHEFSAPLAPRRSTEFTGIVTTSCSQTSS